VFQAGTCEDRELAEERICQSKSQELAGEQWLILSGPMTWTTEPGVLCPLKPGPAKADEHSVSPLRESTTNTNNNNNIRQCKHNILALV